MSVINKMLEDLDRRHGASIAADDTTPAQIRAVPPEKGGRRFFWRGAVVVLVAGAALAAWSIYSDVQVGAVPAPAVRSTAIPSSAAAPATAPPVPVVTLQPAPASAPAETFKLARSLEGPIPVASAVPEAKASKAVPPAPTASSPAVSPAALPASSAPPAALPVPASVPAANQASAVPTPGASSSARVEKRDRIAAPEDKAESAFRRAVVVLNQGRVSEAFAELVSALDIQPGHEGARQALIALHMERGELDAAQRRLEEGLALNRGQAAFTVALARILVERRDYAGAVNVIQRSTDPAASDPDVLGLRGAALQRLSRHAEAAEAYRQSLRQRADSAQGWVGLAISLEALGHKPEAAESYRRGLRAGPLAPGVREYAEQRLRQLN